MADDSPDPQPEPEGDGEAADARHEDEDDGGYTTADFHNVIQKQILNAVYETLAETKVHWSLIEPFLYAAREMCRGDFERTGRVGIHGAVAVGERWVEAEEAFVSVSIADQDEGREWLSRTWWLSDLVLTESDPERVREAVRALELSRLKLEAWLDAQAKGPDEGG